MLSTASAVRSRLKPLAWCLGIGVLWLASCIVEDGDKACSANQVKVDGEGVQYCACAPGYIIDTSTGVDCKACGENEEVVQGKCECAAGYTRPSEGAACGMSSLGASCTDNAGCSGDFPVCITGAGAGYCSESCTASTDCERGWVCDKQGDSKACQKAPAGYGQMCESAADCADTKATYCDTFQSKTCIVTCSKSAPCPGDWSCCDISVAGIVICVEPAALTNGACPAGGKLVTP